MLRHGLLCIAAAVAMLTTAGSVHAVLLYDMEGAPPPSGFGPNGFPGTPTISQDTIGTTQGSNSMKYEVPIDGTFVGALTTVVPAALANPPGIASILFDMTIDTGQEFTGAFAVIGVTVFETGGIPHQFADTEAIGGKAAGLYADIQIDLDDSFGSSFNDIFGSTTSSGFQLFINKSNDEPVTVYIDNIRSIIPEPATGLLVGIGAIAISLIARSSTVSTVVR